MKKKKVSSKNNKRNKPHSYEDALAKARRKSVSEVRDGLSAYVSSASDIPLIIESYNKPQAVMVDFDFFVELVHKASKSLLGKSKNSLSKRELKSKISEMKKRDISDVTYDEISELIPKREKINLKEEIEKAWIPKDYY